MNRRSLFFYDASATAYYKCVTENPLTLPDGSTVTYSYKTLEKWKSQYTLGGLDPDGRIERCENVKEVALYIEKIDEMTRRKSVLLTDF